MVLDASFLNTQHYKEWIKVKVEQSRERISALPLHLGVVTIEKGAFGSLSTMVNNFTYLLPGGRTIVDYLTHDKGYKLSHTYPLGH